MPPLKISHYATLVATLAVTTVGGYAGYQRFAPRPAVAARIVTADVTRGNITATVSATGSVASPTQSKLSFKSAGRLVQLFVNVGDQVAEGQPLAKIDDGDLQVSVAQAQASYNSAIAKLEQLKVGSRPEDVRSAEAQVASAKAKLDQAKNVPNSPDIVSAQSQLESARAKLQQVLAGGSAGDVAAAQAQLDAANAKLQALSNPRPEDLATAQSQLNSAQIKLTQLLNPRPEDIRSAQAQLISAQVKLQALTNPRPEDLATAQAQIDQAKTKLAQLQDQPRTANPADVANAQLAVQNAQVAYDKAIADAGNVGRTGGPSSQAAADAGVKQALINLQTAQNNLAKIQSQGPTDYDVRLAQEAVSSAQASLDKLRNPAPSDIQAAQSAVDQAQASLDKITKPSPFDVQAAQEAVNSAQASLDKLRSPSPADIASAQQAVVAAQASLDKLQHPTDYDVQVAQQAVNQAQASLDKLLNQNSYDVQTAQASYTQALSALDLKKNPSTVQDLAVAMATIDQADAQLKQAQNNLNNATLTAPYAGTVAALGANLGEQASAAVVTLVDTRQVRVDVVVDETDIAKIQPGQTATITFEALPNQRFDGKVTVVAPTATVTQGVVNYAVQIQLDPTRSQGVRPGMTATASIITASKDNVVLVPNRAVKTQGRNRTVEVLDADGKAQSRAVQLGMTNDQISEILSGLAAGDKVVIPTTSTAAARVPGLGGPGGGGAFGGPAGGGPVVVQRGG